MSGPPPNNLTCVSAVSGAGTLTRRARSWACGLAMLAGVAVPAFAAGVAPAPGAIGPGHAAAVGDDELGICSGCTPPLLKHNGSVMGTSTTPGAITITPIYWTPPGYTFSDANYQTIVNQYISDLGADSSGANPIGVGTEYTNAQGTALTYSIAATAPITVTDSFPLTGQCKATNTTKYTACITDDQLQTELKSVTQANNLPTDLAHLYPVFFPPNVQTAADASTYSCQKFNGYHSAFDLYDNDNNVTGTIVYANEPYLDCGKLAYSPNKDNVADAQVDTLSHEISEALTDANPVKGWADSKGNENGDTCGEYYGQPTGYVDPNDTTTGYNQVINGHYYYTQAEFSNAAFNNAVNNNQSSGNGCLVAPYAGTSVTSAARTGTILSDTTSSGTLHDVTLDASPEQLPADGTSTSTVTITALNASGDPVVGEHMYVFTRDDVQTPGNCGSVSDSHGTPAFNGVKDVTDGNGQVRVTYTASTASADCYVMATDMEQGTTNQALLYQGADEQTAPTVNQYLPRFVRVGHTVFFAARATNPTGRDIGDARFDVYLSGLSRGNTGLDASQVRLSYQDAATGGRWKLMSLDGTTTGDGEITGDVALNAANRLAAHGSQIVHFALSLLSGAPTTAQTHSPLRIETDLDQYNPADGAQSNLDYAGPNDVTVTR